jgi:ketosteroid isomerase-like protein
MEPLHRLLDLATEAGILPKMRGKKCTFRASLYANDVALFINPTAANIAGIQQILQAFGAATGL